MNDSRPSLITTFSLWLIFVLGCASSGRYDNPPTAAYQKPPLELLSYRGTRTSNYFIVEGQVRNAAGEKLDRIQAVVETYDSAGQFVTSDDAMIEYLPLMPGQTSPFKVMIRYNPAISNYRVGFKEILGGIVPHTDLSNPPPEPKTKKK